MLTFAQDIINFDLPFFVISLRKPLSTNVLRNSIAISVETFAIKQRTTLKGK